MPDSFRIALITTVYTPQSHADVIISRWLEPRLTDALYGWEKPRTKIATMHVAQRPENDLSLKLCEKFDIPLYDTISDALTDKRDDLAVDAILLIGEHGEYPENEFAQKLYPRKEFFDEVLAVFHRVGRNVPIFFDKHFSWNTEWAAQMYAQIRRENIPFFGGSSISFSPLLPLLETKKQAQFGEVVALFWGCLEPYLFHSLELVQSIIENRADGETGIRQIIAWQDDAVWEALDRGEFSRDLLEASASTISSEASAALRDFCAKREKAVYAFQTIYRDGLKVTHLMQKDVVRKWAVGYRIKDSPVIHAAHVMTDGPEHFFPHFARLNRKIEDFFLSGQSPVPLGRLHLTTQATALCMHALAHPGQPLETPGIVFAPQDYFCRTGKSPFS